MAFVWHWPQVLTRLAGLTLELRVALGEDSMGGVAVGAAGHLFGEAEAVVLAVVALHVAFHRDRGDVVPLHHLLVAVALHADLGVEFAVLVGLRVAEFLDVVQVMAVVAGRRILVAGGNPLAVDRLAVDRLLVVALDALGDHDALVLFPVGVGVDVGVAVGAGHIVLGMDAGIVLGCLLLVAALALHLFDLDLALHVLGEVGNLDVAAGAGILAVHRGGKCAAEILLLWQPRQVAGSMAIPCSARTTPAHSVQRATRTKLLTNFCSMNFLLLQPTPGVAVSLWNRVWDGLSHITLIGAGRPRWFKRPAEPWY